MPEGSRWLKSIALRHLPRPVLRAVKKWHYFRSLRDFDDASEPDLLVASLLVSPGDTAIDVGANIGVYTKRLAARVGPEGQIFSLEPVRETFAVLHSNAERLDLRNVTLLECAASEFDGELDMEIPAYTGGGDNYYQARVTKSSPGSDGSFAVQARTLDSIHRDCRKPVSFIKCDVEGHELACLRGALALIREQAPAWLIEVSEDPDDVRSAARELFELLEREGYAACWFNGHKLVWRTTGDTSVNYFFLKPCHVSLLAARGVEFDPAPRI